jgi:hypothetical protein
VGTPNSGQRMTSGPNRRRQQPPPGVIGSEGQLDDQ